MNLEIVGEVLSLLGFGNPIQPRLRYTIIAIKSN
jgi:hypothetical protein